LSFLKKLFGKKETKERTRVCSQCGMPVDDHKEWCSILKGQEEIQEAEASAGASD